MSREMSEYHALQSEKHIQEIKEKYTLAKYDNFPKLILGFHDSTPDLVFRPHQVICCTELCKV